MLFRSRCPLADDTCRSVVPPIVPVGERGDRFTRCHHPGRIGELEALRPEVAITMLSPSSEHREVLELTHVSKTFRQRNTAVPALVDVDLQLAEGETLGIVGESGSGKSTLMRILSGAEAPDTGERTLGHQVVMEYFAQDEANKLDPTLTVYETLAAGSPHHMVPAIRNILLDHITIDDLCQRARAKGLANGAVMRPVAGHAIA